ncbi:MAG: M23 family metallopeptidase [Pseudomonadota bacterium]
MKPIAFGALMTIFAASGPGAAQDFSMGVPIDCDLTETCFIQQYVDHDTSGEAMDFQCSSLSYDTHQGTDFALKSIEHMRRGVDVIASAPGVVKGTRNGMEDRIYRRGEGDRVNGRECGNGVLIDHGDGWTTQYCHLKRGSVQVRTDDTVEKGAVLGEVGLSGRTQFPHVHVTLRKDGDVVDPFDPDGEITCGQPSTQTLWDTPLTYQPGGVLTVGFADKVPEFNTIKAGTAAVRELPVDAPAIVVFGYAFGGKAGDMMQLRIDGPDGTLIDGEVEIDRNQAQFFRASGRRLSAAQWPAGSYTGTVVLRRDGVEISRNTGTVVVR